MLGSYQRIDFPQKLVEKLKSCHFRLFAPTLQVFHVIGKALKWRCVQLRISHDKEVEVRQGSPGVNVFGQLENLLGFHRLVQVVGDPPDPLHDVAPPLLVPEEQQLALVGKGKTLLHTGQVGILGCWVQELKVEC